MDQIKETILAFLKKETKCKNLDDDMDLMKSGMVTSLFALQIVMFVEKTFHIKLSRKDINAENFRTVNRITALVQRLKEGK